MIGVVAPGEDVSSLLDQHSISTLGSGFVRLKDGRVISSVVGPLFVQAERCWVGESRKRSIPREGDVVIGTIIDSLGDHYVVDIDAPRPGLLDILAFDGASRRNCPNLETGALVFARVIKSEVDFEPRLSCEATGTGKKKDWTTGETQFGELKAGCVFKVRRATCRRLSENNAPLLMALAKHVPFEVCIGFNGRVWIDAEDPQHIALVGAAIRASEGRSLNKADSDVLVAALASTLSKS
jgi:exosome complex component RRP40